MSVDLTAEPNISETNKLLLLEATQDLIIGKLSDWSYVNIVLSLIFPQKPATQYAIEWAENQIKELGL